MTRQTAMIGHVLAVALQVVNAADALFKIGVFPSGWAPYVAFVLAASQSAIGWIQHNYNPNGTPAFEAYIPK